MKAALNVPPSLLDLSIGFDAVRIIREKSSGQVDFYNRCRVDHKVQKLSFCLCFLVDRPPDIRCQKRLLFGQLSTAFNNFSDV